MSDKMNKFLEHSLKALIAILFVGGLTSTNQLLAHSGAHPVRYVSIDGKDEGSCSSVITPCATINYAVQQSGKGDKVRVASGEYAVSGLDIFHLLSDMVVVEGGFSEETKFKKQNAKKYLTTFTVIPAKYRERLAERGFHLVQDKKGQAIKLSIKDKKLLETYEKLTTKPEGPATCVDGFANDYNCNNIDLLSHIPLLEFSSNPTSANDIWGFTNLNDNREYALMGLRNGTVIVDVTNPESPSEVGTISGVSSTWRDIKVYQCQDETSGDYNAWAYVTTESNQGLQVINLNDLPNTVSLENTINDFSTAHNVYLANIDYTNNSALADMEPFLYIAGSDQSAGAYRIFSLGDPSEPKLLTTPPVGTGYVHDATTMVITDNRTEQCLNGHNPCELLIDFNESTVDIWDMTDKTAPTLISATPYDGAQYTHSGWWSADKNYIFIQDELDEIRLGLNTTLRTLDITDLASPTISSTWTGPDQSIDHNGFTKGNHYYMSNYRSGLTVLDVTDPNDISITGSFDTYVVPSQNTAEFDGAWGTYPYLASGNLLVSDINYGLFVLKDNTSPTGYTPSNAVASCSAFANGAGSAGNAGSGSGSGTTTPPSTSSNSGGGSFIYLSIGLLVLVRRRFPF
jgi:choice-of-anchor B domain-containing protein